MILLDTCVVLELMKRESNGAVLRWLRAQPSQQLYTSCITLGEILLAARSHPQVSDRELYEKQVQAMFEEDFQGRILRFGAEEADVYAHLVSDQRELSRPLTHFDAQIAAIALCADARLATRHLARFQRAGLKLVNPWVEGAVPQSV